MTMPQTTVNIWSALGVPGDIFLDGPIRATPYNLVSTCANFIGYAYTTTNGGTPDPNGAAANAGTAAVGGTNVFAGILINSKEYASYGCSSATPLTPTFVLPNNSIGDLLTMGQIVVQLDGAANVGANVYYNNTTGALTVTGGGGTTQVPNATVIRYDLTGASLAVIQLTN